MAIPRGQICPIYRILPIRTFIVKDPIKSWRLRSRKENRPLCRASNRSLAKSRSKRFSLTCEALQRGRKNNHEEHEEHEDFYFPPKTRLMKEKGPFFFFFSSLP